MEGSSWPRFSKRRILNKKQATLGDQDQFAVDAPIFVIIPLSKGIFGTGTA